MGERDLDGHRARWFLDDVNNVRQLVGLIVTRRDLPMRDGVLDPYFFVRNGDIRGVNINVLRSRRLGIGPTEEEALRGDYTNFPRVRHRGEETRIGSRVFPLLWEREPWKGLTIVGFSDGSVRMLEPDELGEAGLAH